MSPLYMPPFLGWSHVTRGARNGDLLCFVVLHLGLRAADVMIWAGQGSEAYEFYVVMAIKE